MVSAGRAGRADKVPGFPEAGRVGAGRAGRDEARQRSAGGQVAPFRPAPGSGTAGMSRGRWAARNVPPAQVSRAPPSQLMPVTAPGRPRAARRGRRAARRRTAARGSRTPRPDDALGRGIPREVAARSCATRVAEVRSTRHQTSYRLNRAQDRAPRDEPILADGEHARSRRSAASASRRARCRVPPRPRGAGDLGDRAEVRRPVTPTSCCGRTGAGPRRRGPEQAQVLEPSCSARQGAGAGR